MNKFRSILFLIFAANYHSIEAHDADSLLPPTAAGSQMWVVSCSDDGSGTPDSLMVSLLNKTRGGPMVSLQVVTAESTPKIFNIADPVGGDKIFSAEVASGYGGDHYILVNKNAAGIASYHFAYHCYSNGSHTGTSITPIQ